MERALSRRFICSHGGRSTDTPRGRFRYAPCGYKIDRASGPTHPQQAATPPASQNRIEMADAELRGFGKGVVSQRLDAELPGKTEAISLDRFVFWRSFR